MHGYQVIDVLVVFKVAFSIILPCVGRFIPITFAKHVPEADDEER